jgi:hypothetical protein
MLHRYPLPLIDVSSVLLYLFSMLFLRDHQKCEMISWSSVVYIFSTHIHTCKKIGVDSFVALITISLVILFFILMR